MSLPYNKSSQFRTQVNQANVIKQCYPCGSNIPCSQTIITPIPNDLTVSTLTVGGKATILGLIDPTGMEFTPVSTNPGNIQANTIWANSTDLNKLYYGNSAVSGGGGGGWVGTATSDLDMAGYNILDCADLDLKGATPSLNFRDTTNAQKASLDYVELNDKVTLLGTSAVVESTGSGKGRLILDANASQVELRSDDVTLRMRQYDPTGATSQAEVAIAPGGNLSMTTIGDVDINTDAHPINLTANDGPINLSCAGGGNITLLAYEGIGITAQNNNVAITGDDSVSITANVNNLTLSAGGVASFGGLETNITSGTNGMSVSSGATLNISSGGGSDTNITSDGYLNLTVAAGLDLTLTNVPAVTTTTANNVGLKATSAGLNVINYLKVKLGGGGWCGHLDSVFDGGPITSLVYQCLSWAHTSHRNIYISHRLRPSVGLFLKSLIVVN